MRSTVVRLGTMAAVLLLILRSVPSAGQQVIYAAPQPTPTVGKVKPPAPITPGPTSQAKTPILAATQAPIPPAPTKAPAQDTSATIAVPEDKPTSKPAEPTDTPAIPEQKPTTVI